LDKHDENADPIRTSTLCSFSGGKHGTDLARDENGHHYASIDAHPVGQGDAHSAGTAMGDGLPRAYRKGRIITSENKQSLEKHEENLDSITTGQGDAQSPQARVMD